VDQQEPVGRTAGTTGEATKRAAADDLVAPMMLIEVPPPPAGVYRQISILRAPRTLWEQLRALFGPRFFDVETAIDRPPAAPTRRDGLA